uniref:Pepsin inhibitor-3-like repeated domain-containing protein n=1 Tax=Panagrolaimus davidi TaxID=227884 RepID=A0A914PYC6_9BILA
MPITSRFYFSSIFIIFSSLAFLAVAQFKEGIGYIGPACAVVEGNLYIHGLLMRPLNSSEISQFETYQDELEKLKKSPSTEPNTHPVIPSFCNDMSDSTEIILKGCIVRDNRVFIKGKLVRPLNSLERETITKLLVSRSPAYTPHTVLFERKKRETKNEIESEPENDSESESETTTTTTKKPEDIAAIKDMQNDVANFLENILKVNSTVAKRFLPVAKMSPLLNELSEGAVNGGSKENTNEPHLREIRTAAASADSIIPFNSFDNYNNNNNNNYFGINNQQPAFAFAGVNQQQQQFIPEQPFQHQLPQLHPLPNFEQPPFVFAEPEQQQQQTQQHFPSFHSYPSTTNNNFENAPAMVNNEPLTSAFLYNGNGQPIEIRGNIRPGDRIMMNGQSYIAVTMNQINPSQLSSMGNIFGSSQPTIQQPINTNYGSFVGSNNAGSQTILPQTQQFWQPNNFNPFQTSPIISTSFGQQSSQNFASQPKIRYHPGKGNSNADGNFDGPSERNTPSLTQADLNAGMNIINQMPHQICTAHIVNPFWFLEK